MTKRFMQDRAFFAFGALLLASGLAAVTGGGEARATGSLSSHSHNLIEERLVLSVGPTRSTVWAQLRLDTDSQTVAMIVPAKPGATLDWVNDGWMEALEAATAPRIVPPDAEAGCPGEIPLDDPVHVAGDFMHHPTLVPSAPLEVLDDAAAVVAWADQNGLMLSGGVALALEELTAYRFVVVRFAAQNAEVLTPTLRVSGPGADALLPMVLTEAGDRDVRVTSWVLGAGRATVTDGPGLALDSVTVTYDLSLGASDYASVSADALGSLGASAWIAESANHRSLSSPLVLPPAHTVPSLTSAYAERAALYVGDFDAEICRDALEAVMDSAAVVAESCPRGELGVVEGMVMCSEVVVAGEIHPSLLRCGAKSDDFAVALSGLAPLDTWLTRFTLHVPQHQLGAFRAVALAAGAALDPVVTATHVDASGCPSGEGGAGGESPTGPGSGAGPNRPSTVVPVFPVSRGCGTTEVGAAVDSTEVYYDEGEDPPDAIYLLEQCGGDSSESYAVSYTDESSSVVPSDESGCSGDSSESYETWEGDYESQPSSSSSDDCGGDTSSTTSSTDDCGGDTSSSYDPYETSGDDFGSDTASSPSGDSCGGDSSEGSGDDSCGGDSSGSSSGDSCGGDSSGSSDDSCGGDSSGSYDGSSIESGASFRGGSASDTQAARVTTEARPLLQRPRARRPRGRVRLSQMTLGAVFLLFPLRRATRRRRRSRKKR